MKLILKETISTLGREGDVVNVKPGYGRNYLLPSKKAVAATAENMALLEQNRAEIKARLDKEKEQAEKLAKKISGMAIIIEQLAGDDERLFGSVTATDISAKLAEQSVDIDKRQIVLVEPIKTLGEYIVQVKVGFQIVADITVKVSRTSAGA
jgi:large subunit ribosomal protein L9